MKPTEEKPAVLYLVTMWDVYLDVVASSCFSSKVKGSIFMQSLFLSSDCTFGKKYLWIFFTGLF